MFPAMTGTRSASDTEHDPPAVPETISAPETKLVYVYLQTTGRCTVDELQRNLDMRKISLFPVLDTLRERDLIDETEVVERKG